MRIERAIVVRKYRRMFNMEFTLSSVDLDFQNYFLLHTKDSMIIKMDLQQTYKISKILNKAFGNWVTSKKYDFI